MLVVIRGAGDLATGIALRLHRAGYQIVMTDLPAPTSIRRTVCFSEAIRLGEMTVEDISARKAETPEEALTLAQSGVVAVLADPAGACIPTLRPGAVVDAILAKKNLGTALTDAPVVIGVGPGFTVGTAAAEPEVLLIAVEKVPDAMVVAMEKARDAALRNVWFVDGDAALLPDMFADGEIDRLYINFCDPWPKSNQKKRRLTHGNFLKKYRQVLAEGGQIHFKTDNDKLFEWSLEEIPQFGFTLSEVTRDLHADGPVGVMTDYERKFYGEGKSINRCVATMVEWTEPEIEDVPSPAE